MRILSLDDEPAQAELIRSILSAEGHTVDIVWDGGQAIRFLENIIVDLVILDWHLPSMSGLDVLGWIRTRIGWNLPVLFLTNRAREDELFVALNSGADDYMIKPVRRKELIARVNALLRRAYPSDVAPETFKVGRYFVDVNTQTVKLDDEPIILTPKEFAITALLFRNVGRVIPRDSLINAIWGRRGDNVSRSLDTHIYRLRSKLHLNSNNGIRLRVIYTHGYRLELTDTAQNNQNDSSCHSGSV